MDNRRDIGEVIKDRLSHAEKSPKNLSWNQIEEQLNKKEQDAFIFKKRHLVALLLLFITSGYIIYYNYPASTFNNSKYELNDDEIISIKKPINNVNESIVKIPNNDSEETNFRNTFSKSKKTNTKENSATIKPFIKKALVKASSNFKTDDTKVDSANNTSEKKITKKPTKDITPRIQTKEIKSEKIYPIEKQNEDIVEVLKTEKSISKDKDTIIYMHPEKENLTNNPIKKRIAVSIHITPSYLFANHINESLISSIIGSNHNKNGNLSLNYGVSLNYKLNDKAALRFGYDRASVKFEEKNIASTSILYAASSLGIDLSGDAQNQLETSEFSNLKQQINYNKASLGLLYKISNKKLTTSIIGDLGFLYQEKNQLILKTDNKSSNLGKNENILRGNISFDLGLNLSYPIFKKIHLFIEPQIEYQIITNDNLETNLNPIIFNLKTGLLLDLQK